MRKRSSCRCSLCSSKSAVPSTECILKVSSTGQVLIFLPRSCRAVGRRREKPVPLKPGRAIKANRTGATEELESSAAPTLLPRRCFGRYPSSAGFSQPEPFHCGPLSILSLMLLGKHFGGSGYTGLEAVRDTCRRPGPGLSQLKPVPSRPSCGVPPGRDTEQCPEQLLRAQPPPFAPAPFPAAARPRSAPDHGTPLRCEPTPRSGPGTTPPNLTRTSLGIGAEGRAPSAVWARGGGRGCPRRCCA